MTFDIEQMRKDRTACRPLQERVGDWMQECFGPEISADKLERGDRLLEEVYELLQSGDYPVDRVAALRDYVWGREKGEPFQEVGGVMITLAAYCLAHGLDMDKAGEAEADRITRPEVVKKIRAKQAAKPVGSALPVDNGSETEIERLTAVNAELLAALEAILATWDGPKYSHFMGPNIDLAREAIAKAKGGDA